MTDTHISFMIGSWMKGTYILHYVMTYIMNDWIRERNDIYNSNIFCLISLVTLLYVITYIIRVHRVPVRSFHLPSPQRESNFVPFFLSLSTVERWRPFSRAFVTSPCRGHPLLLVEHAYASSGIWSSLLTHPPNILFWPWKVIFLSWWNHSRIYSVNHFFIHSISSYRNDTSHYWLVLS